MLSQPRLEKKKFLLYDQSKFGAWTETQKKLGRPKLVTPTWKNQLGKSGSSWNELGIVFFLLETIIAHITSWKVNQNA